MTRKRLTLLGVLAVALTSVVGAVAYFTTTGAGAGTASTGNLNAPTGVNVPATSTGTVHVTWTASSTGVSAIAPEGYYAQRHNGSIWSAACGSSPSFLLPGPSCDDGSMVDGAYTYRVVAVYNSWTAQSASSSSVSVVNDTTSPTSTITFPAALGAYNNAGWNAACSSAICGTAADAPGGSGVVGVKVSVKGPGGTYWNGASFTSATEVKISAAGTTSWTLPFPAANFATSGGGEGTYAVTSYATDGNGNQQTALTSAGFTLDNTAPTDVLTLAPSPAPVGAYLSGSILYYRNAAAGSFKLVDTVTDAGSGPASAHFAAAANWNHALETVSSGVGSKPTIAYTSSLYSWAASGSGAGSQLTTSTDAAGNTSSPGAQVVPTLDNTGPAGGSIGYTDGTYSSASVAVATTNGTDSGSGVNAASGTVKRDSTTFTNDACGIFPGTYATTVTLSGGADTSVTTGHCYRYEYVVLDNVGNQAVYASANVARVATGPATQLVLGAATTTPTAGAGDNLTIVARNADGNTVVTYTGSHSLTFGGAGSIGAFNPTVSNSSGTAIAFGSTTAITFTNGVATVSGASNGVLKLVKSGSASITVTDGTIGNGSGLAVTVGPGSVDHFAVSAPASATAGVAFSTTTLGARDVWGNTATSYAGSHTIVWSGAATSPVPNNTAPSYPASSVSFTAGVATTTLTATLFSAAGPNVLTATEGAVTGSSGAITVGAATATTLAFTTSPVTTSVNVSSGTITVQRRDPYGNPATSGSLTIDLSSSAVTGIFRETLDLLTITQLTLSSGSSTGSFLYRDSTVGTPTITAHATGVTDATQVETVTAGAAAQLVITQQPTSAVAGATIAPAVTVAVRDSYGNVVTGDNSTRVTLAMGANPGAGTLTGGGQVTVASGIATFSGLSIDRVGAGYTLTASDTTGTAGHPVTPATSTPFTISVGTPAKLAITSSAQTITAGGAASGTITVERQDASGNASTLGGAVTVNLTSSAGTGTFRNSANTLTITSVTIASGSSSIGFRYKDSAAGTPTITVADAAAVLTPGTQGVTVNAGAAKVASAGGNWCTAGTWSPSGIPTASDDVTLTGAGATVTIGSGCAAVANSVTLGNATVTTTTLTFAASDSTLAVGGDVVLTAPSGAATRDLQLNAGAMTVGGNLRLSAGASSTAATRINRVTLTSGTVTVGGNLVYNDGNFASVNAAQNQIVISGAAVFNLGGLFTIRNGGGTSTGTLTPGITSRFNFNSAAAQTIPIGVSSIIYSSVYVNNTSAGGATLTAAITTARVTGDLKVQTGALSNGGFAIAGTAGKVFEVDDGATFVLTGTTAFPTGFTPTLTANSTVNFAGGNETVSGTPGYGNLTLSGGSTKTAGSALTVNTAFTIATGTTFAASTFTHNLKGDFSNNGTLAPSTGTVTLSGTGAQSIGGSTNPTTFNNLTINKTGVATLAQNVTMVGNLTVTAGTLDLATSTASRTAAGGTLSVAAGAFLRIGGTVSYPANFSTNTLNLASTVEYYGSAQTVGAVTYGNLTITNAGAKTAAGAVVAAGNFLVNSGTFVASAATTFTGNFTNNGTYTAGATTTFNGSVAQSIGGSGTITFTDLTVAKAAGAATLAKAVSVTGNLSVTGGTLDLATFSADRAALGGTLSVSAGAALRIGGTGAYPAGYATSTLSATSTVEYYGGTQTVASGPTYGNLTISGGGSTKTPAAGLSVAGTFLVSSGATFAAGGFTHSFAGSFTNNGTFAAGAGTASFTGSAAQAIGGTTSPTTFNNLTIGKTSGSATLAQTVSLAGDLTVSGGTLDLATFSADRTAVGGTLALSAGATLRIGGSGAYPAGYATSTLSTTGTVEYYGTTQTVASAPGYGNLTITTAGVKTAGGALAVAGNFLVNSGATFAASNFTHSFAGNLTNSGTFNPGTSTEAFTGSGAQTIGGATSPVTLGNVTVNKTGSATLAQNVTVAGDLSISGGTLDLAAFTASRAAAGGTLSVAAGTTLRIGGAGTFPANYTTNALNATGTVEYYGVTQTVSSTPTYGNLTITTAGTKTAGGGLTVAGAFLVNAGATFAASTFTHSFAGVFTSNGVFSPGTSTESFAGSAAQTIGGTTSPVTLGSLTVAKTGSSATLGQNVSVAGNLSVTSGTLDLGGVTANRTAAGGTLSVSAGATLRIGGTGTYPTNYTTSTLSLTGTVEYYGGTQTVANGPAYANLAVSGGSTKTAAGALTVNGDFTIGSGTTFAASTFSHTLKGNFTNGGTFTPSTGTVTFSGTSAQTLSGSTTTFNNLTIANAAGVSLSGVDANVGALLALGTSVLSTGADKVALTTATTPTRTSGFVNGNLQRTFAAGASTVVFDVGAGATYAPVSVTVAGANAGGTLLASTTAGAHPSYATSGLSQTKYVNRYWTLTAGTLTVTGYNATFTFVAGDLVGAPNTAALLARRWNGASWSAPGSSSSTATTVTGTTFGTAFGSYASGN